VRISSRVGDSIPHDRVILPSGEVAPLLDGRRCATLKGHLRQQETLSSCRQPTLRGSTYPIGGSASDAARPWGKLRRAIVVELHDEFADLLPDATGSVFGRLSVNWSFREMRGGGRACARLMRAACCARVMTRCFAQVSAASRSACAMQGVLRGSSRKSTPHGPQVRAAQQQGKGREAGAPLYAHIRRY
jgi:hypothetical protein